MFNYHVRRSRARLWDLDPRGYIDYTRVMSPEAKRKGKKHVALLVLRRASVI